MNDKDAKNEEADDEKSGTQRLTPRESIFGWQPDPEMIARAVGIENSKLRRRQ